MVMELVEGTAIDRWADARMLSVPERVRLMETVAAAISHAHQRLVIHRDITPLNVLVTGDGVVKLIDFGIARPADAEGATTAVDIAGMGRLLRRLLREAPPELAAVIAKATQADSARRYATADAFAADLVAWRTGFPVAAMEGGRREALAKFVRRHRAWVVALALFVLALATALLAVTMANQRAGAAQAEAEARFERTRGIARTLLFEAFDAVSQVPGATAARNLLAQTGAAYLDELAAMKGAPPDVVAEAGRGYVRLAEVVGGGQVASLGRHADANALLGKAEALLLPLRQAHPHDPAVARAYAALRLEQAGVDLYNNNAADRARGHAAEAEAVLQGLTTRDADAARMVATAIQAQGDSFGWNDDYARALPYHLRAEAFLAGLPAPLRSDRGVMAARSGNLRLLAEAHHKQKHGPEARAANDAAIAINRELVALQPDNPAFQRKLTHALWYAAVVHRTNMRDAQARAAITESLQLARRLVARDPADMGALRMLALVGEVMAQVEMDAGNAAASVALSDEVLAMHARMVEAAGDAPGALRSMTAALRTIGGNYYVMGDVAGACRIWRRAVGHYATMQARGQLTGLDASNGYPEIAGYVRDICDGGARPKLPWEP